MRRSGVCQRGKRVAKSVATFDGKGPRGSGRALLCLKRKCKRNPFKEWEFASDSYLRLVKNILRFVYRSASQSACEIRIDALRSSQCIDEVRARKAQTRS